MFWRLKCKMGRPPIPAELRALIRKMASENCGWDEERIANELLIKLGIRVQKGERLLSWVAETLGGLGIDRRNIGPDAAHRDAVHFV